MIENLDIWNIFFLFAAGQGIFLSIMLMLKFGSKSKNIFIALLILLFSLNMIENVFYWTQSYINNPHVNNSTRTFVFLFGPLFYFYLKEKIGKRDLIHLIPFIAYTIYYTPYYLLSADVKIQYLTGELVRVPAIPYLYAIATSLSLLGYSLLIEFTQKTQLNGDAVSKIKKQFILSFHVLVSMWLLYYILVATINFKVEYDYLISIISAVMIYQIGYVCFLNPKLLLDPKEKYSKSGLKIDELEQFAKILENMMHADKLYLENELRIQDLAIRLNVTTNHVSQIINQYYQKNFTDFVNEFRISEAKKILADPSNNDTILAIAFDVGFNNKTTFNLTFKRITGYSPSEFRKLKIA